MEILNSLNNDNIDDCFYYISTKIKLFDDLGLNDYQKNMIHLIDLPGYGTNNIFEKKINKKVMSICNSFIFVFNNYFKEKTQLNIMKHIFTQLRYAKITFSSQLIKSSLFVINNNDQINIIDKDIDEAKNVIQLIIPEIDRNSINVCFFNAKFYSQYCSEWNFFFNLKNSFTKALNYFSSYNSIYFQSKFTIKKYHTFCEYFYNLLKNKIRSLLGLPRINKEQKIDKNVEKEISEIINSFSKLNNFVDESKYKNKFIKLISFSRENINNLSILKKSNIEGFKNCFSLQINFGYENIQKNIISKFDEIITILDLVFNKNLKQKEDYINKIKKQGFAIIENFKTNIKNSLKNKEDNIVHLLNSKKYQQIFEQINTEIKNHLKELLKEIKFFLDNSEEESLNLYTKNWVIKQISDGKETFPTLPKFREKIAKAFGYKNKNIDEQIFNEITIYIDKFNKIYDKKGFKEWFCSFFYDYKYLMNNCEMIIDFSIDKITYLLKQIIEQYEDYINSIINLINTKAKSLQLDILSDAYIDVKNNIIRIKMKIKDDLYTNSIINP